MTQKMTDERENLGAAPLENQFTNQGAFYF